MINNIYPNTYLEKIENDIYNKSEVDSRDYKPALNYKTGFLDENTVPVYGYLNFGFLPWGRDYYAFMDNMNREVILFVGSKGDPSTISYFKCYRYNYTQNFIYENNPLKPSFLGNSERITEIDYVSNHYIIMYIQNDSNSSLSRWILVKTNGEYDETKWVYVNNLSSLSFSSNINRSSFIDEKYQKLYIVKCVNDSNNLTNWGKIKIDIYDLETLNYVNTIDTIFDMATDIDLSTYTTSTKQISYRGIRSCMNYNNGDVLIMIQIIVYYSTGSINSLSVKNTCLSLNFDENLRANGNGNIIYYISKDLSNYNFFSNSKGFTSIVGDNRYTLNFNEYNNSFYLLKRSSWITTGFYIYCKYFNNLIDFSNFNNLPEVFSTKSYNIIDSSPYAKQNTRSAFFINNYLFGVGISTKYGTVTYVSKYTLPDSLSGYINLLPGQWRLLSSINPNSNIPITTYSKWFVYKNGDNIYHYIYDTSYNVYQINITDDFNLSYTNMNIKLPLPNSSLYAIRNNWGYDFENGIFYWLCEDKNNNGRHVLVWTQDNGTTWNQSPVICSQQANQSAGSYGDGYSRFNSSSNLFIENGIVHIVIFFSTVGGATPSYYNKYDYTNNTVNSFSFQINPYNGPPYLDWIENKGYITSHSYSDWCSYFVINNDLNNLLNNSYSTVLNLLVSPSAGLSCTVVNNPIFLNGRYYQLQATDIPLSPSTDNYIYIQVVDNFNISVFASTTILPETPDKILIAKVTTDVANPISQELYNINMSLLPDKYKFKLIKLLEININNTTNINISSSSYNLDSFTNNIIIAYYYDTVNNKWVMTDNLIYNFSSDFKTLNITTNVTTTLKYNIIILSK